MGGREETEMWISGRRRAIASSHYFNFFTLLRVLRAFAVQIISSPVLRLVMEE